MKKLIIKISITLLFIFGSLSPCHTEQKPLLPQIDVELIILGLKHSESLIKSGKGRFKLYGSSYFANKDEKKTEKPKDKEEKKGAVRRKSYPVVELSFAFSNEHSYFKYLVPQGIEVIFDGRIQLAISQKGKSISVSTGYAFPLEVRNWGFWYKHQWLSDYLLHRKKEEKIRIIGSENLAFGNKNLPCYVVETPDPLLQDSVLRFWITPRGGFRCVQSLRETSKQRRLRRIEYQGYQLKDSKVVWFPKKGISLLAKRPSPKAKWEEPLKNKIEITDFQPNVDVSHFFNLQIPPETKVWNSDLKKFMRFKEIDWHKLKER